jgi:hypothetical protein
MGWKAFDGRRLCADTWDTLYGPFEDFGGVGRGAWRRESAVNRCPWRCIRRRTWSAITRTRLRTQCAWIR